MCCTHKKLYTLSNTSLASYVWGNTVTWNLVNLKQEGIFSQAIIKTLVCQGISSGYLLLLINDVVGLKSTSPIIHKDHEEKA